MSTPKPFMNFVATRAGDAPEHADLKQLCGPGKSQELAALLKGLSLPEPITDASWMDKAENYGDVFLVFFDKSSRNGLVIVDRSNAELQAVWALEGGDYPWASMPRLDLVFCCPGGQLQIDCLK